MRKDTWLALISYIPQKDNNVLIITNAFENYVPFHLVFDRLDADVALGWPNTKEKNHPFLKISKKITFSPLDKITMCGYPGAGSTFNPYDHILDLSFNPAIQEGQVAPLFPGDDATTHQGSMTNIITTGGSSGSPIIDECEEIIGIAQWVIGGEIKAIVEYDNTKYFLPEDKLKDKVLKKNSVVKGSVQVGNVFAISSAIFQDVVKEVVQLEYEKTKLIDLEAKTARLVRIDPPE